MSSSLARNQQEFPPASMVLERLLASLPRDRVSLGWLHGELHEHSFEMLAFIMALIGALPGASVVIGPLMVVPALGMMFSSHMRLPDLMAQRSISTRQASFVLDRAIPLLRSWESPSRAPHARIWKIARPLVGVAVLILGATLLVPVPLSNVFPALTIAGLSLAVFEGDLFLLCLSAGAALLSLAVTAATLFAASQIFASFGF